MSRAHMDNYPTETALVRALLDRVHIASPVLEPAAGAGSIARPLRQAGLHVITNDIAYGSVSWQCDFCGGITARTQVLDADVGFRDFAPKNACKNCNHGDGEVIWLPSSIEPYDCDHYLDATRRELWQEASCKWVVANPPYSVLDDILEMSLQYASHGVAMLLRISALEPAIKRSTRGYSLIAYSDHLRYVMPFSSPRPSYTANGKTDAVTTAWFVWDFGWSWESRRMNSPFQFITDWKQPVVALPEVAGGN